MMTDERIQYFLETDTKHITDEEYKELVEDYFESDKRSFEIAGYSPKSRVQRIWDDHKIDAFWKLIRLHAMKRGKESENYNFTHFIFPVFETTKKSTTKGTLVRDYNFWKRGERYEFDRHVSFNNAIFLDSVDFKRVKFKKGISFFAVEFNDYANFYEAEFEKEAEFNSARFLGETIFWRAQFKSECHFLDTRFFEKVNFKGTAFKGMTEFYQNGFTQAYFDYLLGEPKMSFREVDFPETVIFRNVNFTNISFIQSDISNVRFKECLWLGKRIKLAMEKTEFEVYTAEHFADFESTYRQLKRSFDRDKNWELSGKAYVSEMEMRKKRLWYEKAYYHWFIYWFYSFFGGYTQNIKKPILSLFGLMAIFSVIYFFIDYDPLYALQRGIKGALPYLTTDMDVLIDMKERKEPIFRGYWLIARNIELVLGGTFLSFFILALRKRFKQ